MEKGKRPQKWSASLESDTAEETEVEEPLPKKKLWVVRMPQDQPAGTTFLQAVLWIVWELRALRSAVQDMGIFIGENLEVIGVSVLDEVQLTNRWRWIRTELQDSMVEVLREDLARARIVIPEPERAAAGNAQGTDVEKTEEGNAEMWEADADVGAGAEMEKAEPGPGPEEPAACGKHIYKYL